MERTNRAVTSRKTEQMPEMPVECMWIECGAKTAGSSCETVSGSWSADRAASSWKYAGETGSSTETAQSGSTEKQRKSKEHGTRFCGVPCSGKYCRTFCCVNYLQLKSELTGKIKTVASLETELSQIKEDNNAYESQVTSDVDLNTIKKLAIGRLGMNYPKDDQKKTYTMPSNSYVRQYQEVPESKRW